MLKNIMRGTFVCVTFGLVPSAALSEDVERGAPSRDEIPTVLIVRVPTATGGGSIADQPADAEVDVFPLQVTFSRKADGTTDLERIREQVLELMQQTSPVDVEVGHPAHVLQGLPEGLQQRFIEAEEDSVAAYAAGGDRAVVAWRGYGPVRGYHAGVVAFNSSPYRGYHPYGPRAVYGHNPYFGYYARGRNYPFTYGTYRATPSYHYFAYYRHY